jgi:hypothetical protein
MDPLDYTRRSARVASLATVTEARLVGVDGNERGLGRRGLLALGSGTRGHRTTSNRSISSR